MQDLNPNLKMMMVKRTMRTKMTMKIWMIVMKWVMRKRRMMTIVMMVK